MVPRRRVLWPGRRGSTAQLLVDGAVRVEENVCGGAVDAGEPGERNRHAGLFATSRITACTADSPTSMRPPGSSQLPSSIRPQQPLLRRRAVGPAETRRTGGASPTSTGRSWSPDTSGGFTLDPVLPAVSPPPRCDQSSPLGEATCRSSHKTRHRDAEPASHRPTRERQRPWLLEMHRFSRL